MPGSTDRAGRASAGPEQGAFIVLVGPDGAGKTTIALEIARIRNGKTAYFHFRPPLRRSDMPVTGDGGLQPRPKATGGGSVVVGWLRLARNFVRLWAGYLTNVRPKLREGTLVIGDRWAYGYVTQPAAVRFHGPEWLARLALRLLPRPHLIVNLSAPAAVIRSRKEELSIDQINRELAVWRTFEGARFRTFDAGQRPAEVAAAVLRTLGE